jgi:DNA-binding winged helix-turn-helix (wHTH) protein
MILVIRVSLARERGDLDKTVSYNPPGLQNVSAIVVDVGARLVRREGVDAHLAPKAFELLVILVKNLPNAVRHDQLHAALWPGVHVSETSLAALVTRLRKALGDSSGDGRVIRTLHRVEYAFIGEAIVAGHTPVAGGPVCRLIWHGESIEVPAGQSIIGRDRGCAVQIDADCVAPTRSAQRGRTRRLDRRSREQERHVGGG